MAKQQVEDAVEAIVQELLDILDIDELNDVLILQELLWYLRVYIDKEGGIDIEDCQALSEKLEAELDKGDVVPDSYILEVSSPGIDRVLRKPRDFTREQGKKVDVTLYAPREGKKLLVGELTGFDGDAIELDGAAKIAQADIAQVRLHIDF